MLVMFVSGPSQDLRRSDLDRSRYSIPGDMVLPAASSPSVYTTVPRWPSKYYCYRDALADDLITCVPDFLTTALIPLPMTLD